MVLNDSIDLSTFLAYTRLYVYFVLCLFHVVVSLIKLLSCTGTLLEIKLALDTGSLSESKLQGS